MHKAHLPDVAILALTGKTALVLSLHQLRKRQGVQMRKSVLAMCSGILPKAPKAQAADTEDGEGSAAAVHAGDVDERVLEFLTTVRSA